MNFYNSFDKKIFIKIFPYFQEISTKFEKSKFKSKQNSELQILDLEEKVSFHKSKQKTEKYILMKNLFCWKIETVQRESRQLETEKQKLIASLTAEREHSAEIEAHLKAPFTFIFVDPQNVVPFLKY